MRKVIASALALAMVVPMGLTAFAAKADSVYSFGTNLFNGDGKPVANVDTYKTGDDLYAIIGLESTYGYLTDDDLTKVSFKKEEGGRYIGRPELVEKKFKDYIGGDGRMVAIKLPIIEDWTDKEYKVEVDMEVGAKENMISTGASSSAFPAFTTGSYTTAAADLFLPSNGSVAAANRASFIKAVEAYIPLAEKKKDTAQALLDATQAKDDAKDAVDAKVATGDLKFAVTGSDAVTGDTAFTGIEANYTALSGVASTSWSFYDDTNDILLDETTTPQASEVTALVSTWVAAYKAEVDAKAEDDAAKADKTAQYGVVNAFVTGTQYANEGAFDTAMASFVAYKGVYGGVSDVSLAKGDKLVVKGSFWLKNEKRSSEDETITVGQKGVVVKPVKNEENTVEWEDENDVIARMSFEADSSTTVYFPKLSTKWDNIYYAEKFDGQDAFVREFVSNPDISSTSRPVVELVVPYVDEDGDLTIAEDEIIVYQQIEDGELVDITSKGQFVENDNDELVFQIKTRQLGTYVFAEIPVEEQVAEDEPVEEEGEESAEGGKANPGTGF